MLDTSNVVKNKIIVTDNEVKQIVFKLLIDSYLGSIAYKLPDKLELMSYEERFQYIGWDRNKNLTLSIKPDYILLYKIIEIDNTFSINREEVAKKIIKDYIDELRNDCLFGIICILLDISNDYEDELSIDNSIKEQLFQWIIVNFLDITANMHEFPSTATDDECLNGLKSITNNYDICNKLLLYWLERLNQQTDPIEINNLFPMFLVCNNCNKKLLPLARAMVNKLSTFCKSHYDYEYLLDSMNVLGIKRISNIAFDTDLAKIAIKN